MQLGMIGLGRMGANLTRCLMRDGHQVVVFGVNAGSATIAPGADGAPRTPAKEGGLVAPAENGYLHRGPVGAGHFVEMVHNSIEYGLMAACAEGLNMIDKANAGQASREVDAGTAPLRDPQYYQFDIDTAEVAEVWRRGSVIASWRLDLTAGALGKSPDPGGYCGRVSDSGEGRWTVAAAVDAGVPANVLTTALYERFSSRGEADFGDQLPSAMRSEFGGHVEKAAAGAR